MKSSLLASLAVSSVGLSSGFAPGNPRYLSISSCVNKSHARPSLLRLGYISTSHEDEEYHHQHYSYRYRNSDDVLDMNISEDSIRRHYQQWCAKFHRKQDSFRFIVFQRNYLSQFKWNLAAGKQAFTLNEYADCTEEEYKLLMERAAEAAKYVTTPVHLEEEALEVTVIPDESGFPVDFQTPNNYIDVEVVEKSGWLA